MPAGEPVEVVVVGPVMQDVLARLTRPIARGTDTPSDVVTAPGGAGANVAAWLATTRTVATLVCRVGDDAAGEAVTRTLSEAGVRVHATRDASTATGTCVVLVEPEGERSLLPHQGANAALAPGDIPAHLFTPGRHLHLSGYVLLHPRSRPAGLRALALARGAGMTVSVDPASVAPLVEAGPSAFLGWVNGVDLLLPNADEARALAGAVTVDPAVEALGSWAGAVVCTLGASGAVWYGGGGDLVRAPARDVDVVDTTGAGDAFTAGLLAAWLRGGSPSVALENGCRLAAAAVAVTGAQPRARSGAGQTSTNGSA